jgi:hypothetical protein
MSENELKIEASAKGSKFIDLNAMENGDTIVVTKKFDEIGTKEMPSKFGEGTWTSYFTKVEYNGEEVYMNIKGNYSTSGGYNDPAEIAERFNAVGGEGTQVKITCTQGFTKDKKGKPAVAFDYAFEEVGA